jgi:hypothetical protein
MKYNLAARMSSKSDWHYVICQYCDEFFDITFLNGSDGFQQNEGVLTWNGNVVEILD